MSRTRWWTATTAVLLGLVLAAGATRAAARGVGRQASVKEVTIVAERYKFTPDRIEVMQGDTVRITIRSADGTHGFAIKKLKVETEVPKGGKPVTVEFVADKAGSFPIACSQYCGRGHSQMKAVLDVLPATDGGTR